MTPPSTIHFSQIVFDVSERGRKKYSNIEQLAQSIEDNGLVQPPVLVWLDQIPGGVPNGGVTLYDRFGLDAGGRRYHALQFLLSEGRWDGQMFHGVTSEHHPLRVGYLLKGEAFTSPLDRLLTEICENLDREEVDWRDNVEMIVRAWKMIQVDHASDPEKTKIVMRDGGVMIGCGYQDLRAAVAIHDEIKAHPKDYENITSIRGAYAKLLEKQVLEVSKVRATKSIIRTPLSTSVGVQSEPKQGGDNVVIPLSQSFFNTNSLDFMRSLPENSFDHIVTDPDYAVSKERLNASMVDSGKGIVQENIEGSLLDLQNFIELAFRVVKSQGFCVFFYDLDHHEKLREHALSVGWRVQRWPLIWEKTDYRSNASPQHNFCKNLEYAMVLRKPNAVLAKVQMSSIFRSPTADTVKRFSHPFAKPIDLSKWIYQAIAIKDQIVYDPFGGSFAMSYAAAEFGLRPVASEINPDHYHNGFLNMQDCYRKLIGANVKFS